MGYLKFQNYIFEGSVDNLKNLHGYLKRKYAFFFTNEELCFSADFVNKGAAETLQLHIDSREYYVKEFSDLAAKHNLQLYYNNGSEMGGNDTNDYDEKYFKWKPENLESYGFRKFEVIIVAEDGTEKREEVTRRKYWTVNSAKEYCKVYGRRKTVYFSLSEAYSDLDHKEIDDIFKNGASVFDIYSKCAEFLEWLDDQEPEYFSVTNDKEGKYFKPELPVIFVELEEPEKKSEAVQNIVSDGAGDLPF